MTSKFKPRCEKCGSDKRVRLVPVKKPMGLFTDSKSAWLCPKCESKYRAP